MIGNTNSVISITDQGSGGSGGSSTGDTIYAVNLTEDTITSGNKVLLNLGVMCFDKINEYQLTTTGTPKINPLIFLDDNTFLANLNGSTPAKYSHYLNQWHDESASSFGSNFGLNHLVHCNEDNFKTLSPIVYTGQTGYIVSSTATSAIPQNSVYLGAYNSVDYVWSVTNSAVYTYTPSTNTLQTSVYTHALNTVIRSAVLLNNYIYLIATDNTVYPIAIDNQDSLTLGTTFSLNNFYPLYAIDNYILATDNPAWYQQTQSSNLTQCSPLFIYRQDQTGALNKISLPEFKRFETKTCIVSYQAATNLLSIGTKNNVYFYNYNSTNHKFYELSTNLSLPAIKEQNCYQALLSPMAEHLIIGAITDTLTAKISCYQISGIKNAIVENNSENYNTLNSLSGFATGETNQSGEYEILTALPETSTITIQTSAQADIIEFMGGTI